MSSELDGSGTDILTRWRDQGYAPGFAKLLGFRILSFSEGRAELECAITPEHANLMGGVHGGAMAGLVDAVTGCAMMTMIGADEQFATTDIQVRYVRAAPAGIDRLIAEAEIVHRGRKMGVAECVIRSPDGTIHARGTASMMLTPRPAR